LTVEKGDSNFLRFFRARARQKFPPSRLEFFTAASKPPGPALLYYIVLNNATWSSRDAKTSWDPTNGRLVAKQPRAIHHPGRGPSRALGMTSMRRGVLSPEEASFRPQFQ